MFLILEPLYLAESLGNEDTLVSLNFPALAYLALEKIFVLEPVLPFERFTCNQTSLLICPSISLSSAAFQCVHSGDAWAS